MPHRGVSRGRSDGEQTHADKAWSSRWMPAFG